MKPVLAVAEAIGLSVAVLLVLLVGFCTLFVLPKLRRRGNETYLPPDAPYGPVDQLRSPELLEIQSRKSA